MALNNARDRQPDSGGHIVKRIGPGVKSGKGIDLILFTVVVATRVLPLNNSILPPLIAYSLCIEFSVLVGIVEHYAG